MYSVLWQVRKRVFFNSNWKWRHTFMSEKWEVTTWALKGFDPAQEIGYILQPYLTFTAPINQQISHYKGRESNLRIRKTKMKHSFHGSSLLSSSVCIKRSRNLVWRHFWANRCTDLLRIASLTLSFWPHAPLYHTPLFFLPLSVISLFFYLPRIMIALAWPRTVSASDWGPSNI